MPQILLALFLVVCLALIPLGLPGIWLMLGAGLGFNALVPGAHIGWVTLVGATLLAIVSEVMDLVLSARFTERYGGSRRAGWGAVIGGFVGTIVGVPVPVIGSVIGAFVGAFAGAFVAELTNRGGAGIATRVATGALVGRAVGAALKVAFGLAIASWIFLAAVM